MIAVDTSSLIAFFQGEDADDVKMIIANICNHQLILPPPVLSEVLSDYNLPVKIRNTMLALPQLEIMPEYWQRVGQLRASVLKKNRKARLADALIAQLCIDNGVKLITRDKDFRNFVAVSELDIL